MELKTYFAQDRSGNVIPDAIITLYVSGTEIIASGLQTVGGNTLENPFTADANGKIQFKAPDGLYDMQIKYGDQTGPKVTIQCLDLTTAVVTATQQADRAQQMRDETQAIIDGAGEQSTLVVLAQPDGLKNIGRCANISVLRTLNPTVSGQKIDVVAYHDGWAATNEGPTGGGQFFYDASDTTTADNGGTCFVTTGGKRIKRIYSDLWLEDFGGGFGSADSADQMELAQSVAKSPVRVIANKTYYFSHAVKHRSFGGWIGKNTTFKCITSGSRLPFITSLETQIGVPNDTVHGSSGVDSALFDGIIIDTDYTDITGTLGFQFAENTLDNWTNCTFRNVTFMNAKFDNLALQKNSSRNLFEHVTFINSGQDGMTIRHTCDHNQIIKGCQVINTALVLLGGVRSGDGVVVKGAYTLIDGCYFDNVGNGIKGAGIANNAEDVDTVDQASYGTFTNNVFKGCYGGLGIGTVKQSFIDAGQFIKGITYNNNTFIDTKTTAVSLIYVARVTGGQSEIIGQATASRFAVELNHAIGHTGTYNVSNAVGGAITVTGSKGSATLISDNVSTGSAVNGIVMRDCAGFNLAGTVETCGRRLAAISNFSRGSIDITGNGITISGVDLTNITFSTVKLNISDVQQYGALLTSFSNSTVDAIISDVSKATDAGYYGLRLASGTAPTVRLNSSSSATNKPSYDMIIDASAQKVGLPMSTLLAGKTGRINIVTGATFTKGVEITV